MTSTSSINVTMAQRPRIGADVSPATLKEIKLVSINQGLTIRQMVLVALAKEYRELKEVLDGELRNLE